ASLSWFSARGCVVTPTRRCWLRANLLPKPSDDAFSQRAFRKVQKVDVGMRRVVVTGLGVVAPNGIGKEAFWSACLNGQSGVGPIRSFDASAHPVKVASEVLNFDAGAYLKNGHR